MAKGGKVRGRKGKIGKHKAGIAAYYGNSRHLWNKARRIVRHMARYSNAQHGQPDRVAAQALIALTAAMPLHMSRKFS